ncbi:Rpn family recombination-promoting nuclease/putative transposase [Iningainema tapete]|uniref:Rpn family recombination-promoting nuclease/putative transposase n=1 Tax=Iningainema tapete BLCC-T55 TaxID=2748662 RepID=A0A8J7BZZ5_9CYAN|nr:Rpn family recombination-promoting nuclease/putative transposase [Iningainema tapete]MBD2777063.1 Rpn family recombination-promoting nuclease/putative transposase [Iningainema tapete BLCC-T55]
MKTDSIFYRLFQEFPSIFFELIGEPPQEANAYQFSSVEVKQTAFRIDGVFLPAEKRDVPLYFVEVQFQSDLEIYARLITEICLYLRQNQPSNDWRAVVIYPTRSIDTADIKHYREFFSSQRVSRIYLDQLGEAVSLPISLATVKLVIENEKTAIEQARELIDRTQQQISSPQQQQQLLQLIETILVYKFPQMSRKEIEEMFGLSDLKQTRVYQEAFTEGRQEGKQEGRQEGKQEGTRQQKFRTVPLLLRLGLSVEEVARELELTVEEVGQVAQQPSD